LVAGSALETAGLGELPPEPCQHLARPALRRLPAAGSLSTTPANAGATRVCAECVGTWDQSAAGGETSNHWLS
jgi:hypothetical protein